jgi:phage gp36-like protein
MYIDIQELKKGIRGEVLDTLTRNDQQVAEQAIIEAQAEVAGYLSARYDIDAEFQKTPAAPDRAILTVKLVRDIALYNIFNFSNPANIPANRIKSYENAVALMKSAQAEKANFPGLKRLNTGDDGTVTSSYIAFGGNDKRNNHF